MKSLRQGRPLSVTAKRGTIKRHLHFSEALDTELRALIHVWQRQEYTESGIGAPLTYWTFGKAVEAIVKDWLEHYKVDNPDVAEMLQKIIEGNS